MSKQSGRARTPLALRIVALAFLAAALTAQGEDATTTRINPAVTWGKWEGWGTSLAWWAKVFGDRDDIADLLFTTKDTVIAGESLPGLGMNIARYNAGACSWNAINGRKMIVSKIILPFRQMEGFWLDGKSADPQSKSWDWSVDANQRAMLLKARDRGADHFELFSNSPMWWMCANDNPSGATIRSADNLPRDNYKAFAIYLATIARQAQEHWGVAFTSVEPFNEPISQSWFDNCKQEGCCFSRQSQGAFLPFLRAELDRRGLKGTPIAASDETNYSVALQTWTSFDDSAKALVNKVNVHGYQLAKGPRAELYQTVVAHDRKPLWNSEYGEIIADGMEMARNFHRDMHALHPTAWCYWQPLDRGGWGFIDTDMGKGVLKKVNPKLFVFAQYSRHIRPGMMILESSDADTVAAYDAAERKLVLVVLNDGPARPLACDLSRFASVRGPVARWLTEPLATSRYELQPPLALKGKRLDCTMPADSVQTFEIAGVALQN